jgi:hypothetical protein
VDRAGSTRSAVARHPIGRTYREAGWRPNYDSELDWWHGEQPGPRIVFGDIFVPYLRSKLRARLPQGRIAQLPPPV